MKPGRVHGSCRFDPYFKIEKWSPEIGAWKPIQKNYASAEEARGAARNGRFRISQITEQGREFGEPFDA